jgi:outer membrane protein OmpA-like peptidoglycan-associated protein
MAYAAPKPHGSASPAGETQDAAQAPASAPQAAPAAAPRPQMALQPRRDAFREKAERKAQQKAEKIQRKTGLVPPVFTPTPPGPVKAEVEPWPEPPPMPAHLAGRVPEPKAPEPPPAPPKPKLVARPKPTPAPFVDPEDAPLLPPAEERARQKAAAAPLLMSAPLAEKKPARTKPVFTVHVNPVPAAAPAIITASASAAALPPGPGPAAAAAPPPMSASPSPTRGGRGGSGSGGPPRSPLDPYKQRAVDRDLIVGGVLSSALLLFLGSYVLSQNGGEQAAAPPQPAADPVLRVAAAPKPDALPAGPLELRGPVTPEDAAPPATAPEAAPSVAPPEPVQQAQIPPAAIPNSACERVRMVKAYFCTASSELTPDMRSALESQLTEWAACLGGQPLVVRGYADTRGMSESNISLATARANTLRSMLSSHRIPVAETKGIGELDGLADNQNCANQRRVDVSIGEAQPSAECAKPREAPPLSCG